MRDQTKADLVILLTDGNYYYNNLFGQVRGIGPSDPNAFAIVEAQEAGYFYTFVHELGHLFGARHQQCRIFFTGNCDDTPGDAHGFAFRTGWANQQKWYTVMHQIRYDSSPRLHFSNPNVDVQGTATGNGASNNNARQIREANPTVARFRESVQGLGVSIDGPGYLPLYQNGTWEAGYSCGVGPYTFEWWISPDGFNWDYISSSESISGSFYGCGETKYLYVRVRSGDGQSAETYFTANTDYCGGGRLAAQEDGFQLKLTDIELKEAHPNPVEGRTTIEYFLPQPQAAKLEVLDLKGRVVQVLADGAFEAGWHQRELDSNRLPAGLYLYRLNTGKSSRTKRLMVTK